MGHLLAHLVIFYLCSVSDKRSVGPWIMCRRRLSLEIFMMRKPMCGVWECCVMSCVLERRLFSRPRMRMRRMIRFWKLTLSSRFTFPSKLLISSERSLPEIRPKGSVSKKWSHTSGWECTKMRLGGWSQRRSGTSGWNWPKFDKAGSVGN